MKLSPQEKAARKAAFRAMSPQKKLEHIVTYYKWPILLGLIALTVLGSVLHRQLTQKEPVLYTALLNTAVGEDLERALTDDYLRAFTYDVRRSEVYLYADLYLSDEADELNHEYAYASRMKFMGAVSAQKLDVVLMNREAYTLLSESGYLLPLDELASDALLGPYLCQGEVVLSDNTLDYLLGETEAQERVTRLRTNAVSALGMPLLREAAFDGEIYLGVIANSPRTEEALRYLRYLAASEAA